MDRCESVGGNPFESLPPGADVYVFKRMLRDWDDHTCVSRLRRSRSVMLANGRMLVIDEVIPPRNAPHPAKIVEVIMLVGLTGRERTEPEFRELFAAARLSLTQVVLTPSPLSIVERMPT